VLDLLGLPRPGHMQGRSLVPLLRAEGPVHDAVYVDGVIGEGAEVYSSSIVADEPDGRWSYLNEIVVTRADGDTHFALGDVPELFELRSDPDQQSDQSSQEPERSAALGERLLLFYRESEGLARALGRSRPANLLSPDENEQLRALGYGH
jgi:hypothetical protein